MSDAKTRMRQATPAEVAVVVRVFREARGWTQDTLAALSRIEVRTVQRVEGGERSSRDTKRAIAGALGFEDLDVLSSLVDLPTPEQAEKGRAEFERTHLVLDLAPVDGRGLISLVMELSDYGAIGHQGLAELSAEAQDAFAFVLDFTRDCMDVSDVASKVEMLGYGDELQDGIDRLRMAGQELFAARRRATVAARSGVEAGGPPMPLEIIYLVTAPAGSAPGKVAVPRGAGKGLG